MLCALAVITENSLRRTNSSYCGKRLNFYRKVVSSQELYKVNT